MRAMKCSSGTDPAASRSATTLRPVFQVVISVKMTRADGQRQPAALGDLEDVGAEERQVDGEEQAR